MEVQQVTEQQRHEQMILLQQKQAEEEASRLKEVKRQAELKRIKKEQSIKKEVIKVTKAEQPKKKVVVSTSLSELHALRLRLEGAESMLSQNFHICFGDDAVQDCGLKINQLEVGNETHNENPTGRSNKKAKSQSGHYLIGAHSFL